MYKRASFVFGVLAIGVVIASCATGPATVDGVEFEIAGVLFEDDFSDPAASAEAWEIVAGEPDTVMFIDGEAVLAGPQTVTALVGDTTWERYAISVDVKTTEQQNPWGAIPFYAEDEFTRYAVELNPGKEWVSLQSALEGAESWLENILDLPYRSDEYQSLLIIADGTALQVFVDGESVIDGDYDFLFTSGKVGIRSGWGNQATHFDNFIVYQLQ